MMMSLSLILKGFILGISIMLPGVSGGTMAFLMGIYEKLILEISKFRSKHFKNLFLCLSFKRKQIKNSTLLFWETWDWAFLIPLVFGITCSAIIFVIFAAPIIEQYSLQFYSIIFGFVLASVYKPFKEIRKTTNIFFLLILSFLVNFLLFILGENFSLFSGELISIVFLPIGFLVAIALIIPGISGAYLLLILGFYEKTLLSLRQGDWVVVCCFLMGAILGVLLTARLIKYLIKNYFNETVALILGFIFSSLYAIYPLPKKSLEDILSFDMEKRIFIFYFMISFVLFMIFSLFYKTNSQTTKSSLSC